MVAEGGSALHMDMALVADGNTSLEHNLPQSQLYDDVLTLYAATEVAYVPTLVVTYGGQAGDPYWRQATDVWLHPVLSNHVPPHVLQPGSVRRLTAPDEDFADQVAAAGAKKLADRGVSVSIGAHGQEEGLAAHWEMWSFAPRWHGAAGGPAHSDHCPGGASRLRQRHWLPGNRQAR